MMFLYWDTISFIYFWASLSWVPLMLKLMALPVRIRITLTINTRTTAMVICFLMSSLSMFFPPVRSNRPVTAYPGKQQ